MGEEEDDNKGILGKQRLLTFLNRWTRNEFSQTNDWEANNSNICSKGIQIQWLKCFHHSHSHTHIMHTCRHPKWNHQLGKQMWKVFGPEKKWEEIFRIRKRWSNKRCVSSNEWEKNWWKKTIELDGKQKKEFKNNHYTLCWCVYTYEKVSTSRKESRREEGARVGRALVIKML